MPEASRPTRAWARLIVLAWLSSPPAKANPTPAKFTHNTPLEVAWTLVPILVLVFIGSFSLPALFNQVEIPEADLTVKVTGNPEGESVFRVEQPRGELFYYIRANGTKNLERMRVRTPTFANVPPLLHMLPGCKLPDVPVIVLSIDPCISCTER